VSGTASRPPAEGVRGGVLVAAKNVLFHVVCGRDERRYHALKGRLVRLAARAGLYEPSYLRLLASFVRPGSDVVDAGANVGAYTHALARFVGPAGHVFAFEPVPAVADVLERSCAAMSHVSIHREALSDRSGGEIDLVVPRILGGVPEPALAHLSALAPACDRTIDKIRVPLRRLDDYLDRFRDVSFIKADIEGHECALLAGAVGTLDKFRPVVQLESHGLHEGEAVLREWAARAGYDIFTLRRGRLERASRGTVFSLNVYLIPHAA
jgi:FkbM family methyltransferase